MDEVIPPFGLTLLEVLRELSGDVDAIERDARAHASRALPVVTILGVYNSGKSSLVKRLLLDDARDLPSWLTVSARPETFEALEREAFGCTLRDTPGISSGNEEHERRVYEALALSDAIVITVPPQLFTCERDAIIEILSGRLFIAGGIMFPPSALHVVVSRMDEVGIDPVDNPQGYAELVNRKLAELRSILERAGIDLSEIRLHALCADPFQRATHSRAPARTLFDEARSWDGVSALQDALSELRATLPALRAGALERYFALAASRAHASINDEIERQELGLAACQNDLERLSLIKERLGALSAAAWSSLDGLVGEEIQSAKRMHGLPLVDLVRELNSALGKAIERWRNYYDDAISKLAREADEELAARKESPGRRSLDDLLGTLRDRQGNESDESAGKGWLRRFGPRVADAVRVLHEAALDMPLEVARRELARVEALGFEKYVKEAGKRRLLRDTTHAQELDSAVRLHSAITVVGPLLMELATLYFEEQQEQRAALERVRHLEELQAQIAKAAQAITADEWTEWKERVTVFHTGLDERIGLLSRLESHLAATVAQLERVRDRLASLIAEGARPPAPINFPGPPRPMPSPRAAVDFLLVTALEEERDALLSKLPGARKLDRDGSGAHTYYEAEVATRRQDKAVYRVIVTSLSGMGPTKAAIKASAVIRRWDPPCVLMIGIGGGVGGIVALGDVMVASRVVDYTLGKIGEHGPREERWTVHSADADLLDAATNFATGWEDLVVHPRPEHGSAKRHIGVIASGGDVIASKKQIAIYREDWPKLIGVEMEGGGMAEGLHDDIKRPRFLMIRGVSDLADGENNAEIKRLWRAYACHVAGAYAIGLLRDGPVKARHS